MIAEAERRIAADSYITTTKGIGTEATVRFRQSFEMMRVGLVPCSCPRRHSRDICNSFKLTEISSDSFSLVRNTFTRQPQTGISKNLERQDSNPHF